MNDAHVYIRFASFHFIFFFILFYIVKYFFFLYVGTSTPTVSLVHVHTTMLPHHFQRISNVCGLRTALLYI